jgi:hypothetical protein
MPSLFDLLPERYRRAAGRMMRRRMHRYDRGLPMDLTQPVSAAEAAAAPLPSETVATEPRPWSAVVAAALITLMAGVVAAIAVVELGRPVLGLINEPAVDGMTKLVQLVAAGFVGALCLIVLALAAAHVYAAWRIWRGVNWSLVEGLAVVLLGGLFSVFWLGVTDAGGWRLTPFAIAALGAYTTAAVTLLVSRGWLGPIRFPLNPERAPWWMRRLDRWR